MDLSPYVVFKKHRITCKMGLPIAPLLRAASDSSTAKCSSKCFCPKTEGGKNVLYDFLLQWASSIVMKGPDPLPASPTWKANITRTTFPGFSCVAAQSGFAKIPWNNNLNPNMNKSFCKPDTCHAERLHLWQLSHTAQWQPPLQPFWRAAAIQPHLSVHSEWPQLLCASLT